MSEKITKYGKDMSGNLFEAIKQSTGAKNDAAICRILDIPPSVISKIRHGHARVTAEIVLHIYAKLKAIGDPWSIEEILQEIGE